MHGLANVIMELQFLNQVDKAAEDIQQQHTRVREIWREEERGDAQLAEEAFRLQERELLSSIAARRATLQWSLSVLPLNAASVETAKNTIESTMDEMERMVKNSE